MPRNYLLKDTSKLKEKKITYAMLSKWFKYANPNSFYGSKAKNDIINGVLELINYLEKKT